MFLVNWFANSPDGVLEMFNVSWFSVQVIRIEAVRLKPVYSVISVDFVIYIR